MQRPETLPLIGLALTLITACSTPMERTPPEVHGHRGCRGLLPENTIPAFLHALDLGCDVLELDVVLTGDDHVLVSHEPWMSATICHAADGSPIQKEEEKGLNIHRMTLEQVQAHDCGSLTHPRFPGQQSMPVMKPTLRQVVEAVDRMAVEKGLPTPRYNVEIKSYAAWYGLYQPEPVPYARRVMRELDALGISDRSIVQSFDPAILEAVHAERPGQVMALLVENTDGLQANLARLSFTPSIYSPYFMLVNETMHQELRDKGIELVVWTVNEPADIRRMIDQGVDGIISDYPDRVFAALGVGN